MKIVIDTATALLGRILGSLLGQPFTLIQAQFLIIEHYNGKTPEGSNTRVVEIKSSIMGIKCILTTHAFNHQPTGTVLSSVSSISNFLITQYSFWIR